MTLIKKSSETDTLHLTAFVENFIEFLESNKELITDKKIFNYGLPF